MLKHFLSQLTKITDIAIVVASALVFLAFLTSEGPSSSEIEAANKATAELKVMRSNLLEAVGLKSGGYMDTSGAAFGTGGKGGVYKDIYEQRQFEAKAAGTAGGAAVSGLKALGKKGTAGIQTEAGGTAIAAIAG